MSTYYKLGSLIEGLSSTATAGGTTNLSASSRPIQQFTGTSTQTVVLPDATTLKVGRRFDINNRSTGVITVQDNAAGAVATVPAGSQRFFLVTDVGSAAGVWRTGGVTGSGSGSGFSTEDSLALLGGMAGLNLSTENIESRVLRLNPEGVGGNHWVAPASLSNGRAWHSTSSLNGYGYSIGGLDSANTTIINSTDRYSDDANYWLARANVSGRQGAISFAKSGFIYFVCGSNTNTSANAQTTVQKYADSSNSWSTVTSYPVARMGQFTFALDNYAYVNGGIDSAGAAGQSENYLYDETSDAWRLRSPLPSVRAQGSSFVLSGYGYSMNGSPDNSTVLATGVRYSEVSNSWASAPSTTVSKYHSLGAATNWSGYSSGGYNGSSIATNEELIAEPHYWVARAALSAVRHGGSSGFSLNGGVYFAGGRQLPASTNISSVEKYVPFSLFSLGSLKKSTVVPTSILVATLTNALASNLPIQLRTDGDNWKSFESAGSALKLGETLSAKFFNYPLGYASGGGTGTATTDNERYNDQQNAWETRLALTSARRGPFYFTISGIGYIAGGENSGATVVADTYSYGDITNVWTTKSASLPVAKEEGASFSILDLGYAVCGVISGGSYVATNYQYNGTTDAYATKTVIPISRRSPASFTLNELGFVAGGVATGPVYSGTAGYYYNPILDSWATLGALATGVGDNSGGFAINGFGYSVAGFNGSSDQSTVQKYNPSLNTWASAGNLNTARSKSTVYRIGGFGYASGGAIIANHEQYNPESQTSTNKTSMNVAKVNAGATGAGSYRNYEVRVGIPAFYAGLGSTWVVGTAAPSATDQSGVALGGKGLAVNNSVAFIYTPQTRSWASIGILTGYSYLGQGTFSIQDYAYFCGGADGSNNAETTSKKLNNATLAYTTITSLTTSTGRPGRASLNGFGYIYSGAGGGSIRTATQRYSDTTNAWTAMAVTIGAEAPRSFIAGGFLHQQGGYTGSFLNSTNQFNDAANAWTAKLNGSAIYGVAGGEYLGDGLTTGGNTSPSHASTTLTEAYLVNSNVWVTKSAMNSVKSGQNIFVLEGAYHTHSGSSFEILNPSIKNIVLGLALEVK